MSRIYLDYNATAPLRPEALDAMHELQGQPLNPSSVHEEGRRARAVLEESRRVIAEHVGAFAAEVIFTGSASEANNWALRSARGDIFVSALEHASVYRPAMAAGAAELPVTAQGVIDLEQLDRLLPQESGFLVSLMLASNETGIIQPVSEAATLVHAHGGLLHCDAVQGLGKLPLDMNLLGCDYLTLSAHKMGGPVGAASLVVRSGAPLAPMLLGGGQELNRRAGTENVPAIAGFAAAVKLADPAALLPLRGWLEALEHQLPEGCVVFGREAGRLRNTLCLAAPAVQAETQVIRHDLAGISISAGAACTSGKVEPSRALAAMGVPPELAACAVRISGGWATREEDIAALLPLWRSAAAAA